MNRTLAVALLAAASAGCTAPMVTSVHSLSRASFAPAERPAVWGRALAELQEAGALISFSDPVGGILRTEAQPTTTRCSGSIATTGDGEPPLCDATVLRQLTFSQDGTAILRTNRAVSGVGRWGEPLVTTTDEMHLLEENDATLRAIVAGPFASRLTPPVVRSGFA